MKALKISIETQQDADNVYCWLMMLSAAQRENIHKYLKKQQQIVDWYDFAVYGKLRGIEEMDHVTNKAAWSEVTIPGQMCKIHMVSRFEDIGLNSLLNPIGYTIRKDVFSCTEIYLVPLHTYYNKFDSADLNTKIKERNACEVFFQPWADFQ